MPKVVWTDREQANLERLAGALGEREVLAQAALIQKWRGEGHEVRDVAALVGLLLALYDTAVEEEQ